MPDAMAGGSTAPLYLVASPGPLRERALREIDPGLGEVVDGTEDLLPLGERPPGVVLVVPESLPAEGVLALLRACAASDGAWSPLLVEEGGDGLVAVPVSAGFTYPLETVADFIATGEGRVLLGLREVVARVRSARHDMNNPLAAARAETQLLLLDAEDGELRRALQTVEAQLRRLKKLIASLADVRPPAEDARGAGPKSPDS